MAPTATAIGIDLHGVLAVAGQMGHGRHRARLMRVAHGHSAGCAIRRHHGKYQPRQPRQRAKA
jgi:hypothetical protein